MKERKRKALLGLGVGALACLGTFCLTGCNFIQISQQEYDRLMESVEIVENSVDIFEATEFYYDAMNKCLDTSSDFWNNMHVQTTISYPELGEEYDETIENYFYEIEELEEQVYFRKKIKGNDTFESNEYRTIYTEMGKVKRIFKSGIIFDYEELEYYADSFVNGGILSNDFYLGTMYNDKFEFFKCSDILKAEINESFNYVITVMLSNVSLDDGAIQVETLLIENEIDEDANLVSQTITITIKNDGITSTTKITNIYSYGTVNYEDFQTEFQALKDYEA